jgi:hypothetical protein
LARSVKLRLTLLIPKNTEEALELGKKLSREEVLAYWEEYKRCLRVSRKERLGYLKDCERGLPDLEFPREMLKKAFREQMLRETVQGHLVNDDRHSLTGDQIKKLLRKRRHYGTVSDRTDRKSL